MPRSAEQHAAEEKYRYWSDPEAARQRGKKLRQSERGKNYQKTYASRWYKENKERVLAERAAAPPLSEAEKLARRKKRRAAHLLKSYGISVEEFNRRLEAQGGMCAICRNKIAEPRVAVDHDHQTKEVRGLLCKKCNMALGLLGDDKISTLYGAIAYLRFGAPEGEVQCLKN